MVSRRLAAEAFFAGVFSVVFMGEFGKKQTLARLRSTSPMRRSSPVRAAARPNGGRRGPDHLMNGGSVPTWSRLAPGKNAKTPRREDHAKDISSPIPFAPSRLCVSGLRD